jgi:hypothetical protein
VCSDKLAAPSDTSFDRVVDGYHGLHVWQNAGPNEDFPATCLGLEALCHVHHVAYDRVFHTLFGADIANNSFTIIDANANVQGGLTVALTRGVETHGSTLDLYGGSHGPLRMIWLCQRSPEESQEAVTKVFVERALVRKEDMDHHVKIVVEDVDYLLWWMLLGESRKITDVGE